MNKQKGFVFISLIIVLAIIAILFSLRYRKSEPSQKSTAETGQEAIEHTKQNNAAQIEQNIEIQNQLNTIEQ